MKLLQAAWAKKRPALLASARPGASTASLAELPPALRSLYAWHDGLRDEHLAVEGRFGWCSSTRVRAQKRILDELEAGGFFDNGVEPGGWWNTTWVPFMQFNLEDHVCLDTKGLLGCGRGAVFIRYNADDRRVVLAPSVRDWLAGHVAITLAGPDVEDEEAWVDHFESAKARRLRRAVTPGFPRTVHAPKIRA